MANARTYSDVIDSPQTRCTTCRTVFEVSAELLSSSDTRVRCGECLSIFDALANLRTADDTDDASIEASAAADDTSSTTDVDDRTVDTSDTSLDLSGALSPFDDDAYAPAPAVDGEHESLDVTYADFDLFSEDAELPEVAYLDQTTDTPDFDFDSVEIDQDETFSDTLFAQDETIDAGAAVRVASSTRDLVARIEAAEAELEDPDFLTDDTHVEPIDFNYHDATAGESIVDATTDAGARGDADVDSARSAVAVLEDDDTVVAHDELPGDTSDTATSDTVDKTLPERAVGIFRRLLPVMLILLIAVLVAGLYVLRHRDTLYNQPLARQILIPLCKVVGCAVPSRVDIATLKLLKRDVSSHPDIANALVINVAFRNDAAFAQRYPVLVVRLRNRVGQLVAERDFHPDDYLDSWKPGDTLSAGESLDINLDVNDPGNDAESFEFEFRAAGEDAAIGSR